MATVIVGCKLPAGIVLQNYELVEMPIPLPGGGTAMEKRFVPKGEAVEIAGINSQGGYLPGAQFQGGYALTEIDASFWEAWSAVNAESPLLKNGVLFGQPSRSGAQGKGKEQSSVTSGLEPLVPDTDKRIPKNVVPATA